MALEIVITIFVIVAAVALCIQAAMLAGLFFTALKIRQQVKQSSAGIKTKVDQLVAQVLEVVAESREPVRTATANMVEVSRIIRERTGQVDETLEGLTARTRDQIVRIDELIANLVGKVDSTANTIQRGVTNPVRETFAVIKGVQTALDVVFSRRRPSSVSQATQDQEMFI